MINVKTLVGDIIALDNINDQDVQTFCDGIRTLLKQQSFSSLRRDFGNEVVFNLLNSHFSSNISKLINESFNKLSPSENATIFMIEINNDISNSDILNKSYGTFDEYKESFDAILNAEKRVEETSKKVEEFENRIKSQERQIDNLLPQAITIIGIFVSVLIVLLGGFNLISTLSAINEASIIRLIGSLVFTGQILFNVVFLMMFLLSKISQKPIHTVCLKYTENKLFTVTEKDDIDIINHAKWKHCLNCSHNNYCRPATKLFCKYPYAVIVNVLFVFIELSLFVSVFMRLTIENNLLYDNRSIFPFIVVISSIALVIFVLLCCILFSNLGYDYKCNFADDIESHIDLLATMQESNKRELEILQKSSKDPRYSNDDKMSAEITGSLWKIQSKLVNLICERDVLLAMEYGNKVSSEALNQIKCIFDISKSVSMLNNVIDVENLIIERLEIVREEYGKFVRRKRKYIKNLLISGIVVLLLLGTWYTFCTVNFRDAEIWNKISSDMNNSNISETEQIYSDDKVTINFPEQ